MEIRTFRESDRAALKAITVICFEGVGIDHNIEERYGLINGHDWRWRKARHIDDDIAANAAGIFVAEVAGEVVGYITTRIDDASKIGTIPNLGVLPEHRGQGIGRQLIATATAHATDAGMAFLRIETLAQNLIGQQFYPSEGFAEIARQIHYIKPLGPRA